jgi:hypothetical protein
MEKRRWARILCTIVAVLGFHVAVISLLLATSRLLSVRAPSQSLEFVRISPPAVPQKANLKIRAPDNVTQRRRAPSSETGPPPNDGNNAVQSAPDWAGELTKEAIDAAAKEFAQTPKDFGFPHSSSTPSQKPPQFGWDYAATHRVESISGGGILIHINDNCVLILFPPALPLFAACGIGKRKANGDLFEHMHDPLEPAEPNDTK